MTRPAGSDGVPWRPRGLPLAEAAVDVADWAYVVVEEIVDEVAVLRRWSWPLADPLGRLFWPQETQHDSSAVEVVVLRAQLYEPNGLERLPRPGDTFALVHAGAGAWPDATADLREILTGDVYDVSAEARHAAKLAYRGALAAVLTAAEANATLATDIGEREGSSQAPRLEVGPRSSEPDANR